ncbi:MAG: FAD-binding oxidoreductase [Chloroflexi bacterium]|nr:FAD-binding oxidoreductase [Chloroflexota bacterium]
MSANKTYDVIIAGAGSIGTPTAMYLAQSGLSVLVIEALPSPGQASNKHAIGGVRATHSDPSKINLCSTSIEIFSSWKETYGDDIDWRSGGYSFVAYTHEIERTLKSLLDLQHSLGLNIDWHNKEEILDIAPHLNREGLLGGTFSPEDGSCSPLKAAFSFWQQAQIAGARFNFNERVTDVEVSGNRVRGVKTDKAYYACSTFINAAGGWARQISNMLGVDIPVMPDAHEAGITEPVQPMFDAMVVDIRACPGSSNFYFYQHPTGKIIFCLTPEPRIWGDLTQNSSAFLPQSCLRLVDLMPILGNIRVRRTWRGTYPMTPDGNPIIGPVDGIDGYLVASGTCGQGFMLGPGVGKLLSNVVNGTMDRAEETCLIEMRYNRSFDSKELLK